MLFSSHHGACTAKIAQRDQFSPPTPSWCSSVACPRAMRVPQTSIGYTLMARACTHSLTHEDADKQYGGSSFSPSFSDGEGWITAGRTAGYGKEGNADVFRLLIKDGEVVRSVNLTKSAIWDSGPGWGTHPPVQ